MADFFTRTMESLHRGPLGPLVRLVERFPRLSAWFVLALGMDILLVIEARDVGLLPGQWAALLIATTLVAGLCVWIIGWEDEEEEPPAETPSAVAEESEPPADESGTE